MKINELDVVLLKSNEEATILEKFDDRKIIGSPEALSKYSLEFASPVL